MIPLQRSYAILPGHVTTPIPTNCHDDDLARGKLVSRPPDEPTVATKIILWQRVAAVVRRFYDDLNAPSASSPYDICLRSDRELRDILEAAPRCVDYGSDLSGWAPWVSWLRHTFQSSVAHKFLVIHRPFLGRSFAAPKFQYSREVAVQSARKILEL